MREEGKRVKRGGGRVFYSLIKLSQCIIIVGINARTDRTRIILPSHIVSFFNKFIKPSPLRSLQLTKTALCSSLPNSLFFYHSFLFHMSYITVKAVTAQSQVLYRSSFFLLSWLRMRANESHRPLRFHSHSTMFN